MASDKVRTKELLESKVKNENPTPLYNEEALKKIRKDFEAHKAKFNGSSPVTAGHNTPDDPRFTDTERDALHTSA
jgi:hypothetical protein